MVRSHRARALVVALIAAAGCTRAEAPAPAALPWQPHGLRVPTLACELATPDGFARSTAPMPDHLAELTKPTATGIATIIVAERVEPDLETAAARVRAVWAAGPGTALVRDESLADAAAPAWILARHDADARDLVVLLAFADAPLVEVVARHAADDSAAREAAIALARSLRCR
ncbi:MAG: hypothetical protein K1X88_29960 [Nannocystaceae bacterium]|nr:hypothetical protein [Nannocystaceae bacterium]